MTPLKSLHCFYSKNVNIKENSSLTDPIFLFFFFVSCFMCSDRPLFFFFLSFDEDQYYQTTHEYILDINKILCAHISGITFIG